MDIADHIVNRRIVQGFFPAEPLVPELSNEVKEKDHIISQFSRKLYDLRSDPELFGFFFSNAYNRVKELEMVGRNEIFIQNLVNAIINTLRPVDWVSPNLLLKACSICPVVTNLDKLIWFLANSSYTGGMLAPENEKEEAYSVSYDWALLLRQIQEKERISQKTLDIEKVIRKDIDISQMLFEPWDRRSARFLKALTKAEATELENLYSTRTELGLEIRETEESAERIGHNTDAQWELFLQIINDLAKMERETISTIIEPISSRKKLNTIYNYLSIVNGLGNNHYNLHGNEIELLELYYAVAVRFNKAQMYCRAYTEGEKPFVLHPAIIELAETAKTFNYLFILFHQYRLSQKKETAIMFMAEALNALKRNLNIEETEADLNETSINDLIREFYTTAESFFSANKSSIDDLSFDELQQDIAVVDGSLSPSIAMEDVEKGVKAMFERVWENLRSGENFLSINKTETKRHVLDDINKAEAEIEELENKANARQIVVSLNIIYMFCGVLRGVLTNKRISVKLQDPTLFAKYRFELLEMDRYIVQKVYSGMESDKIGMLEYRENKGIDTTSLSEQESLEDDFHNQQLFGILRDTINSYIINLKEKSVEQLLETKKSIRQEIYSFPKDDKTQEIVSWIDTVSDRISEALYCIHKRNNDDYSKTRTDLLQKLGKNSQMLPATSVDALTTAEILFHRYANEKYADQGFDYSCISALYYQAFEDAYNELIWRNYADMLNNLEIDGKKYTDILTESRNGGIRVKGAKGYLDQSSWNRSFYVEYASNKHPATTVVPRCMYKSFAIIMQKIDKNSNLNGFCDYYASLTGFNSKTEMFLDVDYMDQLRTFTKTVDLSADNRNNASHGGTTIDFKQCKADKKTVINELEEVRNINIGLIQQLLFLLRNKKH